MLSYRKYILEISRCRSFSKASEKLHISQPWLSAAVKKTEQELGLPLFDRSTAPISLTEAGRYYVEQVEKIGHIEEEMERRFAEMRAGSGRRLRIGSSMFFCTYVLPELLTDFRGMHPDIQITLAEGEAENLAEKLQKGDLDLMIEVEEVKGRQLVTVPWASEEVIVAVPKRDPINRKLEEYAYDFDAFLKRDFPGGRRKTVPFSLFADEEFLILSEGHDIRGRSLAICRRAGFEPRVKLQLTQMMTAYYLVCEGQGVAFLRSTIPEFVAPTDSVLFYELDDPAAVRSIYLTYRENAEPLTLDLVKYLEERTAEA